MLVGSLIAYRSTHRTLKAQRRIAEQQMTNAKEVNQAQMNEKLILENRVAWDNETRKLISKLIGQLFSLNHVIEKAGLVQDKLNLASNSKLPDSQKRKLIHLTSNEEQALTAGMESISEAVEIVALIRLHLFENTPNEQRLWNKIISIEQQMTNFEKIPSSELNELTEVARIYFQGNWERSMMINDGDNTVAHV